MSILITKNWRDQKPPLGSQINFGHPLSQGLVGCWLMNEGAGRKIIDLVYPLRPSTFTATIWVNNTLSFNGVNSKILLGDRDDIFLVPNPISIITKIYPKTAGEGTGGRIVTRDNNVGSAGPFLRTVVADNTYQFFVDGTTDLFVKSQAINYNLWQVVASTWDGEVSASGVQIYVNGINSRGAVQNGAGLLSNAGYNLHFGNEQAGSRTFNGDMEYVFIYKCVLSSSAISSLYEAPYQFIQPIRRRIFSIPSAPPVTEEEEYDFMEYNKYW